ncbi:phage terminase small subunit [Priestia sp. OVS21]|nr:phage terminase small subunit [Priestia sp. OVS21]
MKWQKVRREYETTEITLKLLAEKYDIKLGTLKSRKSREAWSRDATKPKKVASNEIRDVTKKRGAPIGNSNAKGNRGNINAAPPKRNTNAVKHGFFSKYLPQESLDIIEEIQNRSLVDMIWDQIMIQYTAIIRAQRIMFVTDQSDLTKDWKKKKSFMTNNSESEEEEYEIQFAWDKHAAFLNSQSRAMSELRSLIKQFDELTYIYDERRLKLQQMVLNIDKTKAEVDTLKKDADPSDQVVILRDINRVKELIKNGNSRSD